MGYRRQESPALSFDIAVFANWYDNLISGEAGTVFFEAAPAPARDKTGFNVPVEIWSGLGPTTVSGTATLGHTGPDADPARPHELRDPHELG